jgi:uncharacterized protein (TIGR03435 family)
MYTGPFPQAKSDHCTLEAQRDNKETIMQRFVTSLILMLIPAALSPALGQVTGNTPAFEVASVKLTQDQVRPPSLSISGNRLTASGLPLKGLILWAYNLPPAQLTGGPGWMDTDAFDINAKAEGEGVLTNHAARKMMQTLLTERFGLALHRNLRNLPVYALVVGARGSKLQGSTSTASPKITVLPTTSDGIMQFTVTKSTLLDFVVVLAGFLKQPVVDQTGLTGDYDFTFKYSPDYYAVGPSLVTAVEQELGLKLQSTKAPVEFLVIEGAKKPSEN